MPRQPVRAFLMTRGVPRKLDYAYLGPAPQTIWWAIVRDRQLVDLNDAEVIAYGDGHALHVLLSGIPSIRRDEVGTRIRYTLIVDGLREEDTDLATRLVWTGLHADDRALLGKRLDERFDSDTVDAMLRGADDGATVSGDLAEILREGWGVPAPAVKSSAYRGKLWTGAAGDRDAQLAFLSRTAWLAADNIGFAITSGLLASPEGVKAELDRLPGQGAVLLTDSDLDGVVELAKKGRPAPMPVPAPGPVPVPVLRRPGVAVTAGAVLVLLIALVAWLTLLA
jgi:hypothetical protein